MEQDEQFGTPNNANGVEDISIQVKNLQAKHKEVLDRINQQKQKVFKQSKSGKTEETSVLKELEENESVIFKKLNNKRKELLEVYKFITSPFSTSSSPPTPPMPSLKKSTDELVKAPSTPTGFQNGSLDFRCGYLFKLSKETTWKKKWFEIRNGFLFEFDKQGGRQKRSTSLIGIEMKEYHPEDMHYSFELTNSRSSVSIILKAESAEEMHMWLNSILKNSVPSSVIQFLSNNSGNSLELEKEYNDKMSKAAIYGSTWDEVIEKLQNHIASKAFDGEWIALEEREQSKPEALFSDALLACNRSKNRYSNILPYNSTRVKLSPQNEDEGSTYINANFVKSSLQSDTGLGFIAAQAPLPNTFDDWYRMLWENNCKVIVMLTKYLEAGKLKAHDYLPQVKVQKFGEIMVELIDEQQISEHFIRKKLKLMKLNEERELHLYHYLSWPDHRVPPDPGALLKMMQVVLENENRSSPQVVHCSAGVGRTGTWIVIRLLREEIQKAADDGRVPCLNLMKTVDHLRTQRSGMLTHPDQYEFCYRTMLSLLQEFKPSQQLLPLTN